MKFWIYKTAGRDPEAHHATSMREKNASVLERIHLIENTST
jgi:hypothetical protein